jgi:hypothetical protein
MRPSRRVLWAYIAVLALRAVYGLAVVEPSAKHPGRSEVAFAVAFALFGAVPAVEVLRRQRWAWIFSTLLFGSFVVLYPFRGGHLLSLILDVAAVGLLLSHPMRRYVGVRLGRRWPFAHPS